VTIRMKIFGATLALLLPLLSAAQSHGPNLAQVTVFMSEDMGSGSYGLNQVKIYVDGVGRHLPANRFFTVTLSPGEHVISSGAAVLIARRQRLDLTLAPGGHVYVLESMEKGTWRNRLAVRQVTCEEFADRHLSEKLRPVTFEKGVLPEKIFPGCPVEVVNNSTGQRP
jgi:hypothetical protein